MPDLSSRIRDTGRSVSVIVLLVCGTVCVWVAADERTLKDRLKLAETVLNRERERNTEAHRLSLLDRSATKASQAALRDAAALVAARIAAVEARVAAIEKGTRP